MSSRFLTIALLTASAALAVGTANAQGSGTSNAGGTAGTSTASPSPGTSATGATEASPGSVPGGSTMGAGMSASPQTAQQPFNASRYTSKADCLTAAKAVNAAMTACDSIAK